MKPRIWQIAINDLNTVEEFNRLVPEASKASVGIKMMLHTAATKARKRFTKEEIGLADLALTAILAASRSRKWTTILRATECSTLMWGETARALAAEKGLIP